MAFLEALLGKLPCCFCGGFVILFFALFGALFILNVKMRDRFNASLRELAAETGCSCTEGSEPVLEGRYRGRGVKVRAYTVVKTKGTGVDEERFKVTYIRAEASHAGRLKDAVCVRHESIETKAEKFLGARDIDTGNPEFDRRYMTEGADENEAKRLLDADVQERMVALSKFLRFVSVTRDMVEADMLPNAGKQEIRSLLDFAVQLAEKAEKA